MYTTLNYSPNFDTKKRKPKEIKFIIFHYTGMRNETKSINLLTSQKSKLSCHYFIKKNGEILTLVPDLYVAWHAGISSWKQFKSINKYSLGIEISNPGHDHQYKNYSKKQINSIIKLSKFLIKKYKIKPNFILGHSDIAPERKKDPGEKFPWQFLSKKKIGNWHNLNLRKLSKVRNKKVSESDKNIFIQNLYKIGYPKKNNKTKTKYSKIITISFQRKFRQALINGIIDQECLKISKNLLNNKDNCA